jgi:hypothetical protein
MTISSGLGLSAVTEVTETEDSTKVGYSPKQPEECKSSPSSLLVVDTSTPLSSHPQQNPGPSYREDREGEGRQYDEMSDVSSSPPMGHDSNGFSAALESLLLGTSPLQSRAPDEEEDLLFLA